MAKSRLPSVGDDSEDVFCETYEINSEETNSKLKEKALKAILLKSAAAELTKSLRSRLSSNTSGRGRLESESSDTEPEQKKDIGS
jgi:hypothetical protein